MQAIIQGFAGGPKPNSPQAIENSGAIANVSDAQLAALSAKAGPALPIQRGKDLGLPKMAPVFDLNAMRDRNTMAIKSKFLGRKRT